VSALEKSLAELGTAMARDVPSSENAYRKAKEQHDNLEAEVQRTGRELKALSGGGPMGLTPEAVRATPEWKAAKVAANKAFAAFRAFNADYVPRFKREITRDRKHQ
jgi:hypothetical protein